MTQANILPNLTWRQTGANSVDLNLPQGKKVEISQNPGVNPPKEFEEFFLDHEYGVSDLVLKQNVEYRNFNNYHEFTGQESVTREFILDKDQDSLYDYHGIEVKEGADATILLDYKSDQDTEVIRNSLFKIRAEKNSKVKLVLIQRLGKQARSFISLVSDIDDSAHVQVIHIELGAQKSYTNYRVNLNGEKSESNIKTAYFVDDNRYLDLAYVMTHRGRESDSDMLVQGVLKDHAVKRFAGTLDFRTGCALSTGNEEEFVTLLDPTVKSRAIPILLAREDDIVGNHAASAGRIDKDMLFYVQSRGFDKTEAKRIIIESKIKPILDYIDDEELREEILEEIREGIK